MTDDVEPLQTLAGRRDPELLGEIAKEGSKKEQRRNIP
jgi:hypothetical protein